MLLKALPAVTLCLLAVSTVQVRATEPTFRATERASALIKSCETPYPQKTPGGSCVDSFFDFGAIARGALASHQHALGPTRYAKCVQAFTQVLRARARGASAALGSAKVDTASLKSSDPSAVPLLIHDEKEQEVRHITLCWEAKGAQPQVVDVRLEEASIVLDYRNQFARILKKNGPDALLHKIQERVPKQSAPSPTRVSH